MTFAEQLQVISNNNVQTKSALDAIKQAIITKGQNPSEDISTWAANIQAIAGTGGGAGFVVNVGTPLNIRLDGNNLVWDAVDISVYQAYSPVLKYYLRLNLGNWKELTSPSYSLLTQQDGELMAEVYAVVTFLLTGNQILQRRL
jgi:hypothetical protein